MFSRAKNKLKSVLKSFQLSLKHFYLVQMSCICICPAISTSWFCTHETLRVKLLNHLCHSCICISSISYLSNLRLSWLCCPDFSLCIAMSSELKHKSRQLELSSLKGDPRRLLSLIVHSCGQSFVYLQEIHNRFWFDQPNQWARATYTEWIFWALFNSPCHQ